MPNLVGPLMTVVLAALDEHETRYLRMDDTTVTFRLAGTRASYDCFVTVDEAMEQVLCYVVLSVKAPVDRRIAVAEALTRANYGLRIGCFELDFDDGEVRYRTSVDVEGGSFAPTMLNNMIAASVTTGDRYHEALMRVMFGDAEPGDAIAIAET